MGVEERVEQAVLAEVIGVFVKKACNQAWRPSDDFDQWEYVNGRTCC